MTARVLIVDPVVTTRIVLKVKLAAAYFNVTHAATIKEALEKAEREAPDVILCEYELEGGGAALLQARLRPLRIPVMALLPEEAKEARTHALAAGVGDVVSRPYDDRDLFARIRNLLRARSTHEELALRTDTSAALGFAEDCASFLGRSRIGIVAETRGQGASWQSALAARMPHDIDILDPAELVKREAAQGPFDALLVGVSGPDARQRLDFVSSLRARTEGRHTAILVVSPHEHADLAVTALDTGAGDVMATGFEPGEAAERLSRLLRRRHVEEALRRSVKAGLEAAVTDPLTGLYNRRYAMPYLERMSQSAELSGRCFALMVLDLDFFKRVNDTHGHAVGDRVLTEFAQRLRANLRSMDLLARLGGEEFLVAMPDTSLEQAKAVAVRLCALTRSESFARDEIIGGVPLSVSVGLVIGGDPDEHDLLRERTQIHHLLEQADLALYAAKAGGRDMVRVCRPAA
ncbi:MAG: diguanylate cyclase [Pseudomonadota bacterium]